VTTVETQGAAKSDPDGLQRDGTLREVTRTETRERDNGGRRERRRGIKRQVMETGKKKDKKEGKEEESRKMKERILKCE
jgi:hypothetical protein